MNLDLVQPGTSVPEDVNVIIEIPLNSNPVKYEIDKKTGALFVDRFLATAMQYPTNYGYIPRTLSEDGDPVDVLLVAPLPLVPGSVARCRPLGMLQMQDESGPDAKILAVPIDELTNLYAHVNSYEDLPRELLGRISHFFDHYKDLEPGKWVEIQGWAGPEQARNEITESVDRYERANRS